MTTSKDSNKYVMEMRGIRKEFPGIVANDNIDICLKEQEVLALLGENGAGKSTLMSILFGLYEPDAGQIFLRGEQVSITDPNSANRYGIGMVHQHFKLVKAFTGLQNVILGVEDTKNGFLQFGKARKKLESLIEQYNLNVDMDMLVRNMTVGMQQKIEILKMLYRENDILVLDEPTAVLVPQEIEELFTIFRRLVDNGKSIIFISHKLNEIMSIADRCTVLRLGKNVGTVDIKDATKENLSEMMVGRKVSLIPEKMDQAVGETVLDVNDLCVYDKRTRSNKITDVSFDVKKGEIVCIAGIDGNGQTELAQAISGMLPVSNGSICINGEDFSHKSIRFRSENGISHIPEDRHKHGLVLDLSLAENCMLQTYHKEPLSIRGRLMAKTIKELAASFIEKYDIRCGKGVNTITRSMSGGNQQKIIIAREFEKNPDLLIAVQPTRGLDVAATEYVHKQLINLRNDGKAILLISLDLEEVMNVSDRIIVFYEGRVTGHLNPQKTTFHEIGMYMSGANKKVV